MSGQRFALIDPAAGISGDMLLGALLELGAPREWLTGLPARLGVPDAAIEIERVERCSVAATKVTIRLAGATEEPGDVSEGALALEAARHHTDEQGPDHHHRGGSGHHGHSHGPGGLHHQHDASVPHRHLAELLRMIERAPLSEWVKQRSTAAFRLLAEAEGRVHGLPPDEVALHEVGAHDALIDIVGAIEGFEQLGIERVYTRPAALGRGWVRAAHGVLPVPAPATSILMEGLAVAPDGPVEGEATTPTGAVLLRVLGQGPVPGRWRPGRIGWGAGARDPGSYPNALKVLLGELADEPAGGGAEPELVVVATDLDDMSPEYLEPLREALHAAGALDVQSWATQMKKGRIGFRVEALAPAALVSEVAGAYFRNSSTAGVRWWPVARRTLARDAWQLDTPGGPVRVKTLHGPTGPRVKPEYDDVMIIARATGQPAHEISRRFQDEALRRIRTAGSAPDGADNAHAKE